MENFVKIMEIKTSKFLKDDEAFFMTKRVYDKVMNGKKISDDDVKEICLLNNCNQTSDEQPR